MEKQQSKTEIFNSKTVFLTEIGTKQDQLRFFEKYQFFNPEVHVHNGSYLLLVHALHVVNGRYYWTYFHIQYSRLGYYDAQKTIHFDTLLNHKKFSINHVIIQYKSLCEEDHSEAVADTAAAEDAASAYPIVVSECGN